MTTPRLARLLCTALLVCLGLYFAAGVWASLQWRYQHDSPLMLYVAWLMTQGRVPYVDTFDMNLPGTYGAYYVLARIFGFSDGGIRAADLTVLLATMTMAWFWLRRLSGSVAWGGALVWGVTYLALGPYHMLQREFLVLVAILAGILSFYSTARPVLRYLGCGLAFGVAMTMKPQAAVGLPFLVLVDLLLPSSDEVQPATLWQRVRQAFPAWLAAAAGLAIPIAAAALFVWRSGGLTPLADMMTNYWPLYGRLGRDHETLEGGLRIQYLLQHYRRLGDYGVWLAPAALGSFVALYAMRLDAAQRRRIAGLLALTFAYSLYPLFTGQFWPYHWFLFAFFLIQTSMLCLLPASNPAAAIAPGGGPSFFALALLGFVIFTQQPLELADQIARGSRQPPPNEGRVDAIATFLERELRPADAVQPLDWTGGAVHAMLIARASLATSFIYDFHFYHHVSRPYIQQLRARFIDELTRARPRFLIEITTEEKPWPTGRDTTRTFEALATLMRDDYTVVHEGEGFRIHERRPAPAPGAAAPVP